MATPATSRRPGTVASLVLACAVLGLASCSSSDAKVATESAPTTIDIAENPDGGTFRLLSYNVTGLPAEISNNDPDRTFPLISPLLNDYEIVMTQEDYDWWKPEGLASTVDFVNYHGYLRADATHEYQSPQHPGAGVLAEERPELELGDGLGLLSELPIEGDERVPWAGCFGGFDQNDGGKADCLAMKGFQVSTLTLANGGTVHLYNVNAEAGSSAKDQSLQAADFEQLAAHIEANTDGGAVIVAGTTNLRLDPSDPENPDGQDARIWAAFLEGAGLTDACEVGSCDPDGPVERVAFRSGGDVAIEASSHDFRTDRFVDGDGEALSEHAPLEVVFAWRPA